MLSVCFDNIRELGRKRAGLGLEQEPGHIGLPQRESKPALGAPGGGRGGGCGGKAWGWGLQLVGRLDREGLRTQCRVDLGPWRGEAVDLDSIPALPLTSGVSLGS